MRTLFGCALAIVLLFGRVDAQSGTIVYGWVASLDVEAPGEMAEVPEALAALGNVPFVLHFTPSGSLMVRDAGERDYVSPARFRATDANLNALVGMLDAWYAVEPNVLYQAYVGEERSSGVKVLGSMDRKRHRVSAGVVPVEWGITEEQREHLGYRVTVAVGETGGEKVEAWFAPDIPVSGGPALYGGLPGMILVLSLNEGRTTYAATEISLDGVGDGLIRVPEVGEARSEEEYRSIVTDHVRQLRQEIGRMVRAYRDVECAVGLRGSLLQCNQSRGNSSQ